MTLLYNTRGKRSKWLVTQKHMKILGNSYNLKCSKVGLLFPYASCKLLIYDASTTRLIILYHCDGWLALLSYLYIHRLLLLEHFQKRLCFASTLSPISFCSIKTCIFVLENLNFYIKKDFKSSKRDSVFCSLVLMRYLRFHEQLKDSGNFISALCKLMTPY